MLFHYFTLYNDNNNLVQYRLASDVNARSTLLSESCQRLRTRSMITADYYYPERGYTMFIFSNLGMKNGWYGWGFEPATSDLHSQLGTFDNSPIVTSSLQENSAGKAIIIFMRVTADYHCPD